MNIVNNTLSKNAFYMVNKAVAKHLKSNDAAILLSELIFLHKQHDKKQMVFLNQERLMQNCNLTLHRLRSSMTLLLEEELVYREKKKGVNDTTPKNYYRVFFENVDKILDTYDDRRAVIQSTGEQVTTSVSRDLDDRLADNLSTGDQDSSAHINKLPTKKVEPNKVLPNKAIKYSNSSNKPIGKDLVIDKSSIDIKYINSVPENMLTKEQITIKSNHFFS